MTGSTPAVSIADDVIPPKSETLQAVQASAAQGDLIGLAHHISRDVGLSSAVLRVVNSAFYGLAARVSDIRQSVVILGTTRVTDLVTAYEMRRSLSKRRPCITLERYWDCAEDTANVCGWILHQLDLRIPLEDAYAAGLFHDCGLPLMAMHFADYRDLLERANRGEGPDIVTQERSRYGIDHAELGVRWGKAWGLPETLCDIIGHHHDRDIDQAVSDPATRRLLAVLKWAEQIVDQGRRGQDNVEWPHYRDWVARTLDLAIPQMETLQEQIADRWRNA